MNPMLMDPLIIERQFLFALLIVIGVSSVVSILLYSLLKPVFLAWVEKTFFPEKENYKKLLENATRHIARVKSPVRLFSLVIHFVTMSLGVANAAVLVKDPKGVFHLAHQRGYQELENIGLSLDGRNPVISFLEHEE